LTPTHPPVAPRIFVPHQHSIEVQPSYGINDSKSSDARESIEYAEQDFAERQ